MKHLAIAFLGLCLIAADFLSGLPALHVARANQHAWSVADSLFLGFALMWFALHWGRDS